MWKLRCSDLDNRMSIVSQRELGWTPTDLGRASMPVSNSYSSSTPAVTPNVQSQRACYSCGDVGHLKRNCPRLKRDITLVALVLTKGHMRLSVTVTIKVIRTIAVTGLLLRLPVVLTFVWILVMFILWPILMDIVIWR